MKNAEKIELGAMEINKENLDSLIRKFQDQYNSKVYSIEMYNKNHEDPLLLYLFGLNEFEEYIDNSVISKIDLLRFEMIDSDGKDITFSIDKDGHSITVSELEFRVSTQSFEGKEPCEYYKIENGVIGKYNRVTKLYYSLDKNCEWKENGRVLSWIVGSDYDYDKIKSGVK